MSWQEPLIQDLISLAEANPDALALAIIGSLGRGGSTPDEWSDVDALLVAPDGALDRLYPDLGWLRPLGEVYACSQSREEHRAVARLCFTDLRRLDLIVETESSIRSLGEHPRAAYADGMRVLFSRSPELLRILSSPMPAPPLPPFPINSFEALVGDFWFKGVVVVQRVVRNDLLVARDLVLRLEQDCLLLAMLLRDRAKGTCHHRGQDTWSERLERLPKEKHPGDPASLLRRHEALCHLFEQWATEWDPTYTPKRALMLALIAQARRKLRG
jgi:hypothetical protein